MPTMRKEGPILVLNSTCPWQEWVVPDDRFLFIVRPNNDKQWSVRAIPIKIGSFENKKQLPKSWAGKMEGTLAQITGVSDAIFCHRNCFLARAQSKEGVLKLAELAVKDEEH